MTTRPRRSSATGPDHTTRYAERVVAGRILAGKPVRDACARHLRDIEQQKRRKIRWDKRAAADAFSFFEDVLVLAEGAYADKPFRLMGWQQFVVGSLFGWKGEDGHRRFRTAYIETGKGPLALDTPIPTPAGWTTMGTLEPGDQVFDEAGRPCNVTAVSPVFTGRTCYRLTFSDGGEIVADEQHEWWVASLRNGKRPGPRKDVDRKGGYAIRSTGEIARTYRLPESTSRHPQARWNHRIDVAGALELPELDLPVPPYTLGVWLGDGDSDCSRITSAPEDVEVRDAVTADGFAVTAARTLRYRIGSTGGAWAPGNLNGRLRRLGLFRNKHIPRWYLRASRDQRLALLQGLLDTDGSIDDRGHVEFSTKLPRLAQDVAELIRSLGFKVRVREGAAMLNGREVGRRHRLLFRPSIDVPVFKLTRKLRRQRPAPETRQLSKGRMIVGCDVVPSVPVRCITVDAPSHLFLAGETMIPTHNSGKSPMLAGIGLYGLVADGEQAAEIYTAAVTRDQAGIMFRDADLMVAKSKALQARITRTAHNLANLSDASFLRPVSAEGRSLDGKRPHMALIDEIHEHRTPVVVEKMRAGTKARKQALILMITNSGYDRNSVCWHYHHRAVQVAAGTAEDDSLFGFVCSLDAEDLKDDRFLDDERSWVKVNPSLVEKDGGIPGWKYLREQVREARGMPHKTNVVKRLNFCIWTEAEGQWVGLERWENGSVTVDPVLLEGRRCYGGLDLSSTTDLTAFVLAFPLEDGSMDVLPAFWLPGESLREKELRDAQPYTEWRDRGLLMTTPGRSIDEVAIAKYIADVYERYDLRGIAFDRWGMKYLLPRLDDEGLYTVRIGTAERDKAPPPPGGSLALYDWGQGFRDMSDPLKHVQKLLSDDMIRHGGNPILRMCAANAVATQDAAEGLKWDKSKSLGRIDGLVAMTMAIGLAINPASRASLTVYENRGLRRL